MKKTQQVLKLRGVVSALFLGVSMTLCGNAGVIGNVVETGGDNEPTDTITAQWTGQTWNVTVANEPLPGLTVGAPYTAGFFRSGAPAFVDRSHVYLDDTVNGLPIPGYLLGGEYIMSGNDNRDNALYRLDLTLNSPATVFMLIDNRLSDGDNMNPPTFDATHMQWIIDQGWAATANGLNRFADSGVPDEVAIDEGADGTINQWYSVYTKQFGAGDLSLYQADNSGRNMYGVVVVPEPTTLVLLGLGGFGLFAARRRGK